MAAEIYSVYDELEAQKIIGLLRKNGIGCNLRDMGITPYPIKIGRFGEIRVVVEEDHIFASIRIIKDAIRHRLISRDGNFLVSDR